MSAVVRSIVLAMSVAVSLNAQAPASDTSLCPVIPRAATPSDEQKREAQQVAEQARQASILDDRRTARNLFKRAVQLDPTNANTVYALARSYDEAKESRAAIGEYCRFLALAPEAPEVGDVKTRVATLAQDIARVRAEVVRHLGPPPERSVQMIQRRERNDGVFALAAVMPGLGQYYTGRPVWGAAVTASSLTALYWGLQSRRNVVTQPVRQTVVERPHLAAGVTAAVGVSVLAAIEAYLHMHGTARKQTERAEASLLILPSREYVGLGISLPVSR